MTPALHEDGSLRSASNCTGRPPAATPSYGPTPFPAFSRTLAELFEQAAARFAGSARGEANLYQRNYDISQIELFSLLAKLAFVADADSTANRLLASAGARSDSVAIVDVGIGLGRQLARLLSEHGAKWRHVTVYGIDPDRDSLAQARELVMSTASDQNVACDFHAIEGLVEHVPTSVWSHVAALRVPKLVNAAYALHHIGVAYGSDPRLEVLRRVRACNPEIVVLTEPNVDHMVEDRDVRARNCWLHFNEVFRLIHMLDADARHKALLQTEFFGREVLDILSESNERSERHERSQAWRRRLQLAGFEPSPPAIAPPEPPRPVVATVRPDGIEYHSNGIGLISVMAWSPRKDFAG